VTVRRPPARFAALALATASIILMGGQCQQRTTFVVTHTGDLADSDPGDGLCEAADGSCTLRAAVQESNALPGRQGIRLGAGVHLLSIPGRREDDAAQGDLDLRDDVDVMGEGSDQTWVDAQGLDRVFHVHPGVEASFDRLLIQDGRAKQDVGGGIAVEDAGVANLHLVGVNANRATNGGGIHVAPFGALTLDRSTVSYNRAEQNGGGIANQGFATLGISTLSGNEAIGYGGGIHQGPDALVSLTNVTLNLNSASVGGGIDNRDGVLAIVNTILANSPNGGNCSAGVASSGHNLVNDYSCDATGEGDIQGGVVRLSGLHAFADEGIAVHVPLEGCDSIDNGDRAVNPNGGDQLGAKPALKQIGAAAKLTDSFSSFFGRLYVPVSQLGFVGGEVAVYGTFSHSLLKTIPLGNVTAAAVHPYGSHLYLARGTFDQPVANELRMYHLPGEQYFHTVPLPGVPLALAPSPDGKTLYVVGSDFDPDVAYITIIDTASGTHQNLTGLPFAPLFLDAAVGATGSFLFITGQGSDINVLATNSNQLTLPIHIGSGAPARIAAGTTPPRLYVNNGDLGVPELSAVIPFQIGTLGTNMSPPSGLDIAVHNDGNRVYAGWGVQRFIDVIDVQGGTTTTIVGASAVLEPHPSAQLMYGGGLVLGTGYAVDVIATSTNSVIATLPVASWVQQMAVKP
jgi:hypothetical protein